MKKTKAKLELKKSTIRVLEANALTGIVSGGPPTENPEYCRIMSPDDDGLVGGARPGKG